MAESSERSAIAADRAAIDKLKRIMASFYCFDLTAWDEGYDLLVDALRKGHTEIVKELLRRGVPVTRESESRYGVMMPIYWAFEHDDLEVIGMVMEQSNRYLYEAGLSYLHDMVNHYVGRKYFEHAKVFLDRLIRLSNSKIINLRDLGKNLYEKALYCARAQKDLNGSTRLFSSRILETGMSDDTKIMLLLTTIDYIIRNHVEMVGDINEFEPLLDEDDLALHKILLEFNRNFSRMKVQEIFGKESPNDVVKMVFVALMKHGFVIRTQDRKNHYLLRYAIEYGSSDDVEAHLKYGADVNWNGGSTCRTHLYTAVHKKQAEIVKILIQHGANVNTKNSKDSRTPLYAAVDSKQVEIAKLLIQHGADVTVECIKGVSLIYRAVSNKDVDMLKLLLSSGCVIKDWHILFLVAIDERCKEIGEIILQTVSKTDINKEGESLLHEIIRLPPLGDKHKTNDLFNADMVQLCLNNGAAVNAKDSYGWSPLHRAVDRKFAKTVEVLLKNGAEVNSRNNDGMTPLSIAVQQDRLAILVEYCRDGIETKASSGAFFYSSNLVRNTERIFKILQGFGADDKELFVHDRAVHYMASNGLIWRNINFRMFHEVEDEADEDLELLDNCGKEASAIMEQHIRRMEFLNLRVDYLHKL